MHSAKILVVDDNEQNRALAEATIGEEGYEVILAASGEEGLRAFEDKRPDCVLLDVQMPGLDGFAVCERIRSLSAGAEVPIIFLTALRDIGTFDRALLVGADDFLTKPIKPTELIVRVQAALKLRRLSAELRDHYELIRRQRDDLMRLQLQKEMLTAFVVHDLKNPVGSMDLFAQTLLRDRRLPQDVRDTAAQIRSEARHLLRLIHNLLDISKSEEGKLVPKLVDVDLLALIDEVLQQFDVHARASQVTLARAVEVPSLMADRDLLERVLENLTENAIRHAPFGTEVRIGATRSEGSVEIEVMDRGAGIPLEMREKIFDRFVQLDTSSRAASRSGRGLGLAFCKLAVEAHGGGMSVEDASPGTIISIRLPAGA